MCRDIWKRAGRKGAMCNGQPRIVAQVVSLFSLNNWSQSEGEERGKIKNEKQKRGLWKITEERFSRSFCLTLLDDPLRYSGLRSEQPVK